MPRTETYEDKTQAPDSLGRLLRDLRDDAVSLVRQEVALAKREMAEKVSSIGKNAVFLVVGAFIGLYCLLFLLLACNSGIQAGLFAAGFSGSVASWLAPLALGILLGAAALFFTLKALRTLRKARPVPEQTFATLREDRDWLKGKVK